MGCELSLVGLVGFLTTLRVFLNGLFLRILLNSLRAGVLVLGDVKGLGEGFLFNWLNVVISFDIGMNILKVPDPLCLRRHNFRLINFRIWLVL